MRIRYLSEDRYHPTPVDMFKNDFWYIHILTHLGKITVEIKTANVNDAGTNGRVYLGIGRREFRLNKTGNQFEPGSTDTFVIGVDGNIDNPNNVNDLPLGAHMNAPEIQFSAVDNNPVYIRFEPGNINDNWNVESVRLTAQQYDGTDPGDVSQYADPFSENDNRIWLGYNSGLIIVLVGAGF